jgi:hypothetical protein
MRGIYGPDERGLTRDLTQMRVEAGDDVRRVVSERGGELYVWVVTHGSGCCRLTMVEADTSPPRERGMFCRLPQDGFDVLVEAERLLWPRRLVLEVHGRRCKVRAYWNGLGWVG